MLKPKIFYKTTGGGDMCPFIQCWNSGGAAMAANFLPLDKEINITSPSYSKVEWAGRDCSSWL